MGILRRSAWCPQLSSEDAASPFIPYVCADVAAACLGGWDRPTRPDQSKESEKEGAQVRCASSWEKGKVWRVFQWILVKLALSSDSREQGVD